MAPFSTPPQSAFPTTSWSELGRLNSPDFANALAGLCVKYWYPVYAFIRRQGADADHAEDLTQAFFAKVLAQQTFRAADPSKGRFRSFLLATVRNFLVNEHAAQQTQRRGGSAQILSIDYVAADQLYLRNRSAGDSPSDDFDRAWAIAMLERAIERLRDEYEAKQQLQRFDLLVPSLQSATLDYDAIAAALAITTNAARQAASRFRKCYGQILCDEISSTLSESGSLDDEIAWIMKVFSQ